MLLALGTRTQFQVTGLTFQSHPFLLIDNDNKKADVLEKKGKYPLLILRRGQYLNFVICYAGKGVPPINQNIVPTVQVAVQMYSGTLTTEQTFGIDPLEQQLAKKDIRNTAFKNYFPTF